jgi:hypothetical protein
MRLTFVFATIGVGALFAAGQLMPKKPVADHSLDALRVGADGESVKTQLQIREVSLDAKMPKCQTAGTAREPCRCCSTRKRNSFNGASRL